MYYYKFVKWDVPDPKDILEIPRIKVFVEADKGNLSPLKEARIATPRPYSECRGWRFVFIDNLKEYWVKFQWPGGGNTEIKSWYALKKGDIRYRFREQYGISPKNIIRIMEVPDAR